MVKESGSGHLDGIERLLDSKRLILGWRAER